MKSNFLLSLTTCLFLALFLADADATPIAVPNFSFDSPAVADGAVAFSVTSWNESGSGAFQSGVFNPQDAQFPGSSGSGDLPAPALGQQAVFLNIGGAAGVSRTTASPLTTIQANTTYTLTIAVGVRLDFPLPGVIFGETVMDLLLPNGQTVGGTRLVINANNITRGTFADFSISFTTNASSPLIGQDIRAFVGYAGDSNSGVMIDNVRLDATPVPATLLNISTRLRVLNGNDVLIGGFIITGTDPKRVVIRGIGPSLAQFFSGSLADPTLELHHGGTTVETNDNWKTKSNGTSQQAEVEATGVAPTDDLESALVVTLDPGTYTAILAGQNNGVGIGVIEVYDVDAAARSKLANISTRGFVDTGDNVMIGGFIIGGGANGHVVIRAIGPSLTAAGIPNALQDPLLELHDVNGTLLTNDNWQSTQQAEIEATGLAPTDIHESAIVTSLPAGNYTAIVRGVGGTVGVAVVEGYNIP